MKKIGIAVDDHKLTVFREELTKDGFTYEDGGSLTGDTTLLTVKTNDVIRLEKTVRRCQQICSKKKKTY